MDAQLIDTILDRIASGEALRTICVQLGTTAQSFLRRVDANPALAEQYARARQACGDMMDSLVQSVADQCVTGEVEPNAARVAIDAYKWRAAHLRPKVYGDRVTQEVTGPAGAPLQLGITLRRVDKPEPL